MIQLTNTKACPFCGSQPELSISNSGSDVFAHLMCSSRYMCGVKPHTSGMSTTHHWSREYGNKRHRSDEEAMTDATDRAIEKWNRRSGA